MADSILECNGLINPLVLKQIGVECYTVISGNIEYYAAPKAREKNPRKCERVNAFIISPKDEDAVTRQLKVLEVTIRYKKKCNCILPQIPPIEVSALSQITPQEARTLLSFMQAHIPEPTKLNPAMTWEESQQIDRLFEKIHAVLSCRADKEVPK